MADILNSALTGDADFAGAIFNPKPPEAPAEPEKPSTEASEAQEQAPEAKSDPTPKEEVAKSEQPKVEPKAEKKAKATKEEAAKAIEETTKKVSETKEEVKPESSVEDNDLPINPHFQDKEVADKPEGDDSEKGISSWKEIKAEMKKAREERDSLRAELEAAKEKATQFEGQEFKALNEQLENYKTQLAQLEVELQKANVTRHPRYRKEVAEPLNGLQADLKAIAEANDADFSKLWNALIEPDAHKRTDALEDLTADFKRMEQLSIVKMADKYQDLAARHAQWEEESTRFAEVEAAEKAKQEQEFIENDRRLQKAFTAKTWTNLEDRYDFLREIDGQDAWNSSLREARKAASETDLDRLKIEDRSAILARAAVVPFLESAISHYSSQLKNQVEARDKKIAELEEQVKSMVGATPSLGGTTEEVSDEEEIDDKSLTNFGASIFR